jgi:hypothetical protein
MAKRTIILRTTFPADECLHRIENVADPAKSTTFSLSGYRGLKPLLIKVDGLEIAIWKRTYYRKYVQRVFYAKLILETNGARLEGHFDMPHFQRVVNLVWLAVVAVIAVPFTIAFFTDPPDLLNDRWSKLIPLGMLTFGLLLFTLGPSFGEGQERFIIETLREALAAQVQIIEPDSAAGDAYTNRPVG